MRWAGTVVLGVGALAYSGAIGTTEFHRHGAHQIVHVLNGDISVDFEGATVSHVSRIVIPGGVAHAIRSVENSTTATSIYLDVDTLWGKAVHDAVADSSPAVWSAAFDEVVADWPVSIDMAGAPTGHRQLVESLSAVTDVDHVESVHPYVRAALAALSERITSPTSLADIASIVNVSVPHLSRLWRADMGISFPAWVRWTRLREAARLVGSGATITDAAHDVGFADGAHASRVCREMFGMSPLEITRSIGIV